MRILLSIILLACIPFCNRAQSIELEFSPGVRDNIPENFIPFNHGQFSKKGSFWVKVSISSKVEKNVILQTGNWYMQQVSFFNEFQEFFFIGNYSEIKLVKGNNIFYLFYPFADDKDRNWVTIDISEVSSFNKELLNTRSFQQIFASIVMFLFFLSTTYSIVLRWEDRVYTHYALYLLTIAIFFTYQYGILGEIFPIVRRIPPAYFWIFSDFITLTFIYFAQSFLNLPKADPFLYKLYDTGKYVLGLMVVIETTSYLFGFDALHSVWYKAPIFAFEIVIFPLIFYRVYKLKTALSWLFLASSIILAAANLGGQTVSTLKEVASFNIIIQTGMLIDVFIFSIGIGIRMGIINKEKQMFQSEFVNQMKINTGILERQASELELKVAERTKDLNKRNQENELLVREIHHRVKNNMQVISSMLNIAGKKIDDEKTRQPFLDSTNRINSMGLIHSFLYQNEDYPNVNTKKYINQLTNILSSAFNSSARKVQFHNQVDGSVVLDMDSAINVGLIVNELVTNSLKHGVYKDDKPSIKISLLLQDGEIQLSIKDNGQNSLTNDQDINRNFGLRLVDALAKKLNGDVVIENQSGFEVKVIF